MAVVVGLLGFTLVGAGAVGAQGTTTVVPTTAPPTTSPPATLPPPESTITVVATTSSTTTSTTAPAPVPPPQGEVTDGAGRASAWMSHSSGPPGTVLTIEGDGCPQLDWGDWDWRVEVFASNPFAPEQPSSVQITEPVGEPSNGGWIETAEWTPVKQVRTLVAPLPDGTWSAELVIPAEAQFLEEPPISMVGTVMDMRALCLAMEGPGAGYVQYSLGTFEITAPGSPAVENPRPAEPIAAVPMLTG